MRRISIPYNFKGRTLKIIIGLGVISLALFTFFLVDIFRARVIDIENANKILAEKSKQENNSFGISKVTFQQGSNDKGLDLRCLSWSSKQLSSGWSDEIDQRKDHDFFIDYYIPSGKKAIICATPALSASLAVHPKKRFLYEVSKISLDDGLYVRIVIGLSESREFCKSVTGKVTCMNSILGQQAIVKYEP